MEGLLIKLEAQLTELAPQKSLHDNKWLSQRCMMLRKWFSNINEWEKPDITTWTSQDLLKFCIWEASEKIQVKDGKTKAQQHTHFYKSRCYYILMFVRLLVDMRSVNTELGEITFKEIIDRIPDKYIYGHVKMVNKDVLLSGDQINTMLQLASDPFEYLLIQICQHYAPRISALCAMECDHIWQEDGSLKECFMLYEKSKSIIQQPMYPLVMKAFMDVRDELIKTNAKYIWLDKYRNISTRGIMMTKLFEKVGKQCGLQMKLTCHMFRYTFVSRLGKHDNDIKVVSKLLGHKSSNNTYRFYYRTEVGEIYDKLQDATHLVEKSSTSDDEAIDEVPELEDIVAALNAVLSDGGEMKCKEAIEVLYEEFPLLRDVVAKITASVGSYSCCSDSTIGV